MTIVYLLFGRELWWLTRKVDWPVIDTLKVTGILLLMTEIDPLIVDDVDWPCLILIVHLWNYLLLMEWWWLPTLLRWLIDANCHWLLVIVISLMMTIAVVLYDDWWCGRNITVWWLIVQWWWRIVVIQWRQLTIVLTNDDGGIRLAIDIDIIIVDT